MSSMLSTGAVRRVRCGVRCRVRCRVRCGVWFRVRFMVRFMVRFRVRFRIRFRIRFRTEVGNVVRCRVDKAVGYRATRRGGGGGGGGGGGSRYLLTYSIGRRSRPPGNALHTDVCVRERKR